MKISKKQAIELLDKAKSEIENADFFITMAGAFKNEPYLNEAIADASHGLNEAYSQVDKAIKEINK